MDVDEDTEDAVDEFEFELVMLAWTADMVPLLFCARFGELVVTGIVTGVVAIADAFAVASFSLSFSLLEARLALVRAVVVAVA